MLLGQQKKLIREKIVAIIRIANAHNIVSKTNKNAATIKGARQRSPVSQRDIGSVRQTCSVKIDLKLHAKNDPRKSILCGIDIAWLTSKYSGNDWLI